MKIFWDSQSINETFPAPIVTIGNFDGVHAGHQAIFHQVRERAAQAGGTACVITFEPHPQKVLFPDREFFLLNHLEEKIDIIRACGINVMFCLPFTPEFAAQDPRAFVKEFLVDTLRAQEIYLGRDSRFGRGREGSPETLRALGDAHGFRVTIVPPVTMNGMTVSSTSIRRLLHHGEVEQAAALLRRHYALDGVVSYGTQRGSQLLGFPTANVDVTHELIPKTGVYIGSVAWNGRKFQAVVNIGANPTFSNARLTVEAHLLDFEGNLYGEWMTVALLKRLRDEITFPDIHALTAQIERDVATARAYFQAQA